MSQWITVAKASEIAPGQAKCVDVGKLPIALFNIDGTLYAIDDTCTHSGGPLSEGDLDGTEVTCPWHGAVFDLKTGEALNPPARKGVSCYKVQVNNGEIQINMPS